MLLLLLLLLLLLFVMSEDYGVVDEKNNAKKEKRFPFSSFPHNLTKIHSHNAIASKQNGEEEE